jgi:hypothetical protein
MKDLVQRLGNNKSIINAIDFSDNVQVCVAGTTAKSVTVPAGAEFVVFSATGDFAADAFKTAVAYTADNTAGTASEMNPAIRYLKGVTTISVIAAQANTYVTLSFYS